MSVYLGNSKVELTGIKEIIGADIIEAYSYDYYQVGDKVFFNRRNDGINGWWIFNEIPQNPSQTFSGYIYQILSTTGTYMYKVKTVLPEKIDIILNIKQDNAKVISFNEEGII